VGQSNAAFRALADQTRRDILKLLRAGPRTSGELASRFHSSWPTISRHLAVLRDGGLVVAERQGQEIYYELNTSVFQDLAQQLMEWASPRVPEGSGRTRPRRRAHKPQEA
jgi:DNA-binding transcriptional ArsR family regulator